MISGRNSASTTARAISSWKFAMAVAVNISPRNKTTNHPARLRIIFQREMRMYGSSSASMPPNFWISSVASCSATSSMSSIVTMPTSTPLESTTGSAARAYLRNVFSASCCESVTFNATNVWSRKSLTFASSGRSRNSRIRRSSMSFPWSSTT